MIVIAATTLLFVLRLAALLVGRVWFVERTADSTPEEPLRRDSLKQYLWGRDDAGRIQHWH